MRNQEETDFLTRLGSEVKEGVIVEIGTYEGMSAVALSRNTTREIYTLDPHEERLKFGPKDLFAFYHNMLIHDCKAKPICLSSEYVTPKWNRDVGLLWIDGDHSYEAVKRDFYCWEPHLANTAKIAFDDSGRKDVKRVIDELLQDGYIIVNKVGKITVIQ